MKLRHLPAGARKGFTLIELLIVVAIVALLVGLLSAGVMRAVSKANETANAWEIHQLKVSLENFKNRYGIYPPSKMTLARDYGTMALDSASLAVIQKMFPRLSSSNWPAGGVNWAGAISDTGPWTLYGDQCLVFFLGGVPVGNDASSPSTPGCNGFRQADLDPLGSWVGAAVDPFYEFKPNRLVFRPDRTTTPFFSYLDPYGDSNGLGTASGNSKPYVYFSSYNTRNGYKQGATGDQIAFTASEIVNPYLDGSGANRYQNPTTFQIISAGRNQHFGTSTAWSTNAYYTSGDGVDDQTNFHDRPLGVR